MDENSRDDDSMEVLAEDYSNSDSDRDSDEVVPLTPRMYLSRLLVQQSTNFGAQGASQGHHSSDSDNAEETHTAGITVNFDTELPTEHSYLGNMNQVSGVGYLESGKYYIMLIFVNYSMVFPGETLPMIIPHYLFDPTLFADEATLLFGVIFPKMFKSTKPNLYGVTCQIYERRNDERDNVIIKCRVHQRFVVTRKHNKNFSELLEPLQRKMYATVLILPEIILPDPLSSLELGSLNRFRNIDSLNYKLRQIQASTTIWPQFVYDKYKIASIIERAKKYITSYKIDSMPTDMTCMSFWLCRNLIFDTAERIKVFVTNSVNMRMQIIAKSLDWKRYFCCSRCKNRIANCSSLFAMSKHGVQTNYCNPAGFIHETITVYAIKKDALYPSGEASTDFSWFPGYSWQILLCRFCGIHIGWKFDAVKSNLVPGSFFALSGVNVVVDIVSDSEPVNNGDQLVNYNEPEDLRNYLHNIED